MLNLKTCHEFNKCNFKKTIGLQNFYVTSFLEFAILSYLCLLKIIIPQLMQMIKGWVLKMNFNSNELLHTLDFKVKQVFVHLLLRYFFELQEMEYILQL